MPKVVRFHQLGGPEVLKFEDQPSREPNAGEVRIRVQAVGLNRAEALYIRGLYLEQPRLPSGLGYEAAGIVDRAINRRRWLKWIWIAAIVVVISIAIAIARDVG